jgi:hypothetical protein
MKIGLVLIALLTSSLVCASFSIEPCLSQQNNVKFGLFYYSWYNGVSRNSNNETVWQGHWNGTPSGQPDSTVWTVIDQPLLGFYNSSDPNIIKQHLNWFKLLGIDFLIVSWWGMPPYDYGQEAHVDNAVKELYSIDNSTSSDIKIVLMVEGFNETADNYDFGYIRNYIKTNYTDVYPNLCLRIGTLPLLCWYNAANMTGTVDKPRPDRIAQIHDNSSSFADRILGHNSYVDWYAWTPSTVNDSTIPVLKNGFTVIEPRYDYSHINNSYLAYDPTYSEDLYGSQWNQVKSWIHTQSVEYVAIYSWNEYHERSMIEPHNTTDDNIIMKPFTETYQYTIPEFPSFLILPLFFMTTLLAVIFYRKRRTV